MSQLWNRPSARALVLLLLVLISLPAAASRRGSEPRLSLELERSEAFTGEPYGARIAVRSDGFVYFYSLDSQGYVSLLYPVLAEDGRGQVRAGDTLWLHPLYAGSQAGLEQLVAVHTREYRPIRASRQHFLAPDPQDLPDVNARLTRVEKELDNYATGLLSVMETGVTQLAQVDEEVEEDEDVSVGIVMHHHVYDYWCPYCDCWHPACTHDHCWCSWEVVHHYHGYYRYHHCFLWDGWHPWWRPPVVYIYLQGGSPWDYDTRPWRSRRVWAERRHYSDRWRSLETPRIQDRDAWREPPRRQSTDKPEFINLKKRLDVDTPSLAPRAPSVISTEPDLPGLPDKPRDGSRPSTLSTGPGSVQRPTPQVDAPPASKPKPKPATTSGKGKKKKAPAVTPDSRKDKDDSKPESKPEAKPEPRPEPAKPSKPSKPRPGHTS
ncbi:MAG: hypothetical protein WC326_06950 [Candidatus Delongbacteria bacterium]